MGVASLKGAFLLSCFIHQSVGEQPGSPRRIADGKIDQIRVVAFGIDAELFLWIINFLLVSVFVLLYGVIVDVFVLKVVVDAVIRLHVFIIIDDDIVAIGVGCRLFLLVLKIVFFTMFLRNF